MMRPPSAPEGVRLHFRDGTSQAVECRYRGKRRGVYRWEVTVMANLGDLDSMTIEVLPAHTEVAVVVGARPGVTWGRRWIVALILSLALWWLIIDWLWI